MFGHIRPAFAAAVLFMVAADVVVHAQLPTASDTLTVEEISFPGGSSAIVGQPFEMVVVFRETRAGACRSSRWFVTAPDGTEHDVLGGLPEVGCSKEPGRQAMRAIFWDAQPGPRSRKPWPMVPGRYTVRVEISDYTAGGRGLQSATGPAVTRSAEFIARDAAASGTPAQGSPLSASSDEVRRALGTMPPQFLATVYLMTRSRLALLARAERDTAAAAAVILDGEVVTRANVDRLRGRLQQREQAYAAELQRRGVPQVAGAYRLEANRTCEGAPPAATVTLAQDGFNVAVRRDTADGELVISGVAAGGILTLGSGDFTPDTYMFGPLDAPARIELRSFAGMGCPMTLTRIEKR